MTTVNKGDEVTIILKGKVQGDGTAYDGCRKIEDGSGRCHYVYFPSFEYTASGCAVTVAKKAESLVFGQPYKDSDGDVFIRTSDGWIDRYGDRQGDAYPSRPMVRLDQAPTVTLEKVQETISAFIRTKGSIGKISTLSAGALARELVRSGVKVAP